MDPMKFERAKVPGDGVLLLKEARKRV